MQFPKFNMRDMVNAQRPVGHVSGAGISAPKNEVQNREIATFLDVVTERGKKLQ